MGGMSKSSGRSQSSIISPRLDKAWIGGTAQQRDLTEVAIDAFGSLNNNATEDLINLVNAGVLSIEWTNNAIGTDGLAAGIYELATQTVTIRGNTSESTQHTYNNSRNRFTVSESKMGAIVHELAHALHYHNVRKIVKHNDLYRIYHKGDADANTILVTAYTQRSKSRQTIGSFMGRISKYSKTSSAEAIAEAMSDVILNGSKSRVESRLVTNAFIDYYK